eukprot:907825-Pleurochrysis_carterae.AAC.1
MACGSRPCPCRSAQPASCSCRAARWSTPPGGPPASPTAAARALPSTTHTTQQPHDAAINVGTTAASRGKWGEIGARSRQVKRLRMKRAAVVMRFTNLAVAPHRLNAEGDRSDRNTSGPPLPRLQTPASDPSETRGPSKADRAATRS